MITENLRSDLVPMLIEQGKEFLEGYHIDLSKYIQHVTRDNDVTVSVHFTARDSKRTISVVECYYNETEILQGTLIFD